MIKRKKFLHKIICCGDLLESPRGGDSNRSPQHMILWITNDNYAKNLLESGLLLRFSWGRRCQRNVLDTEIMCMPVTTAAKDSDKEIVLMNSS